MSRRTIGTVAKQAGVNIETIRFYERKGLIEKPTPITTSFREYPEETVDRILFIKRAQDLGFTLAEVAELLHLTSLASAPRSEVKALAATKLESVRGKIKDLQRMERTLKHLVGQCSGRGSIAGCPIIEALSGSTSTAST